MFGLCDANNFYASCERVFNPSLIGRPVVVLSNNDGCVIARSNEAKKLGIEMGAPYFQIKQLARRGNVAVFSSNFVLYGDMSRRVMGLLKKFVPATEVYSIDEAFLDFTGMDETKLDELGHKIASTVKRYTGIPVSIGIAPTKTLAKIASKLCKQYPKLNGCCFMHRPQDIEKVLRKFPIEDVWGVGRRYAKMLKANGVDTAWDFTQLTPEWVRKRMSVVGLRMWKELRGEACIGFEQAPADKKQIATTRTFAHDIDDFGELHQSVVQYAVACAEKLRQQNSVCGEIVVFILTNRHKDNIPQHYESRLVKLSVPTDSTLELTKYASGLLRQIYRKGYAYKRAGVILSDISSKKGTQRDMFDTTDRDKHDRLMKTVDGLNASFGRHKIVPAAAGMKFFRMNREHLSKKFTTDWENIIRVKT
ncbi:Y-family DNA polymerase [uncultured Alistipes sp.]|uniref:Y-family DNA polymerase n=1 Tax=uncultured Alistipes sp. TaxID=538949 RepID=UPI00262E7243|nr:Y-family DNA polymerase [uncultured Alistipes sp.]